MTKTIKRLLPAALAVLLAGCAMQPVDSTTTRYRVALVAKNNRDSEFWDAVFIGAEAAATEYNLQLTITAPDDEEDYAAQNQLIADAVEDGAQAIVFSAIDYEANAAAIDAAAAAGVTVISVDSAVNSDNVAAYIGADNYGAGRMVAQSALDGMEGALCVGLINYEVNGANGRDREQDMAIGALQAIQAAGRTVNKDIYLVGVDALDAAKNEVANGNMTGTVLNDAKGQATQAVASMEELLGGKTFEANHQSVYVDYVKVTPDNVKDFQ